MTALGPDTSRNRRIEDPSNLWLIHPAARRLLPWFVSNRISANAVSAGGLIIGGAAALAYSEWRMWPFACLGLLLSVAWLVADGLDGMIARATNTASSLGRFLDGLCDHGVFVLIYLALAISIGSSEAWILGTAAGLFHALQSNLYESERARFSRRIIGIPGARASMDDNPIVRAYDGLGALIDTKAHRFDDALRHHPHPVRLGATYSDLASRPLRLMSLLSANVRVFVIFVACVAGDAALFWWFEIIPLTLILIVGLSWHRSVEFHLVARSSSPATPFQHQKSTRSKGVTD